MGYESELTENTIHRFKYSHYLWPSNQTHTFPNMSCKAKKLCLRYYSWVLDHPQIQLMEQIGLIYYHKCSNELFCREECVRSARGGVSNRSIIH